MSTCTTVDVSWSLSHFSSVVVWWAQPWSRVGIDS